MDSVTQVNRPGKDCMHVLWERDTVRESAREREREREKGRGSVSERKRESERERQRGECE